MHRYVFHRCRPDDTPDQTPSSSPVPDYLPSGAQDWREFRAKLVAVGRNSDADSDIWAHSVPGPEQGCILIAHPLMFASSQEYFFQVEQADAPWAICNELNCSGAAPVSPMHVAGSQQHPLEQECCAARRLSSSSSSTTSLAALV